MRRIVGAMLTLALLFILVPAVEANAAIRWDAKVVYVENHAPGWPVRKVVERMDNELNLNLKVVRKCPKKSKCIRVRGVKSLPGRIVGQAHRWWVNDEFVKVKVSFDNSWRPYTTYRQRKSLICHEMGHALGLNHSRSSKSCMYKTSTKYRSSHLSRKDKNKLKRWY